MKAMHALVSANISDGLLPIYVDPKDGKFFDSPVTLGARGDSFYEYAFKASVSHFHKDDGKGSREARKWLLRQFYTSLKGILEKLVRRTNGESGLLYLSEQPQSIGALFVARRNARLQAKEKEKKK